jgi:hypothetical protein
VNDDVCMYVRYIVCRYSIHIFDVSLHDSIALWLVTSHRMHTICRASYHTTLLICTRVHIACIVMHTHACAHMQAKLSHHSFDMCVYVHIACIVMHIHACAQFAGPVITPLF